MADDRSNPHVNPYSVFLSGLRGNAPKPSRNRRQRKSNYRSDYSTQFVPESHADDVSFNEPPNPGTAPKNPRSRRYRKSKPRSKARKDPSDTRSMESNPNPLQSDPVSTQAVLLPTQPVPESHADDVIFLETTVPSSFPVPPPRLYLATNPVSLYFGGFLYKKRGAHARGVQFNCDARASGCRASLRLGEGAEASRNESPHNHERPTEPTEAGVSLKDGYNCMREEFRKLKRQKLKVRQKARKLMLKVSAHPEVHVPQSSHLLPPMVHKPQPGTPLPQLPRRPAMKPLAPKPPRPVTPPHVPPPPPPEVCLRWNSYHSNMQATFPSLLNNEQFVDVTLACEGRSIKCHKMMLSACSSYFDELLTQNPCQHPIVLMKDLKFWEIQALVDFMYCGEVNVGQDKLPSLLAAAEALQIKGLAGPASTPGGGSMGDEDSLPPASYDSDYAPDRDVPSPSQSQSRRARKRRVVPPPPQQQQQQQQQQQVVPPPRSIRLQQRSATATSGSAPPPAAAPSRHQPPHPSEPPARRMRMELTPSNIVETLREIKLEPLDIDDDSLPVCDDLRPPDITHDLDDISNDFDNATTNDTTNDITNDITDDFDNGTANDTTKDSIANQEPSGQEQANNLDPDPSKAGSALPTPGEKSSSPGEAVPGSTPAPDDV